MSTNLYKPEDWVSQAEAARIRGVTRQAIGRLIKKGRLQVWLVGGRSLVRRGEVETYSPKIAGRRPK
jgi:excisionase family DNA binding protein